MPAKPKPVVSEPEARRAKEAEKFRQAMLKPLAKTPSAPTKPQKKVYHWRMEEQAAKPKPEKIPYKPTTAGAPYGMLAARPAEPDKKPGPAELPAEHPTAAKKVGVNPGDRLAPTASRPTTMRRLSDIPERVQQGWPSADMRLRGGVSRLLNWMPDSVSNYKKVELHFTSNGRTWIPVARGLRKGSAVMWTVPVVSSTKCQLRIVGLGDKGAQTILVTSPQFTVDTGTWKTIDLSGFKAEVKEKKKK